MEQGILPQDDFEAVNLFQLSEQIPKGALQIVGYLGVHHQGDLFDMVALAEVEQLPPNFQANCR